MTEPKYGTPEWDEYVAKVRQDLEKAHGTVYNTDEVTTAFDIEWFLAPLCGGTRRSTGEKITLMFQHSPRFYWE